MRINMKRSITLVAAIFALAMLGGAPAIAAFFNPGSGRAAAYNGSWDLEKTKSVAFDKCGSGCRIVASGKKTCAAVVESISTETSAWAVGYSTTTSGAANQGWHECRRKGGVNCKTAAAICD
jgi:hypothetical protein